MSESGKVEGFEIIDGLEKSPERFGTFELRKMAGEWFAAFSNRDIEALLSLYADDDEIEGGPAHYSPNAVDSEVAPDGWIRGKENMRKWWTPFLESTTGPTYKLERIFTDDDGFMATYLKTLGGQETEVAEKYIVTEIKDGLRIKLSRVFNS